MDDATPPREPLPPVLRIGGSVVRKLFGSITDMSLDDIRRHQARAERNPLTDLLVGRPAPGVRISDRTVTDCATEGSDHPLPVRIYTPEREPVCPRPLVLYLHGGGWTLGDVVSYDSVCSRVSLEVDAVVVSVDYRLAPDHRFPAGLEDSYRALLWAAEAAETLGADPTRLGIMGDSAGGNLSAVITMLTRDRGGPRLVHQALLYPATDATMSSAFTGDNGGYLDGDQVRAYLTHYLGQAVDQANPLVSPLRATSHAGLPPAIVVLAGHDPLYAEGMRYAKALRDAGIPAELSVWPAMPHGFVSSPYLARDARAALRNVTRSQIAVLRAS